MNAEQRLHELAIELAAMAQNGLTYATGNRYDTARYRRMRGMSAEILSMLSGTSVEEFSRAIDAETGHATPKLDVRGALFDEHDRVLLVQEKRDDKWNLPGGWADALDTPSDAIEREVAEEAGLRVRASRLAAVQDGSRHNGHTMPFHVYKLMFLVERLDDAEPTAGLDEETIDVAFFPIDELPELSSRRTNEAQLQLMLDYHRDPTRTTSFD